MQKGRGGGGLQFLGTSVLAAVGPASGTDMPLFAAIRSRNITYTRESRAPEPTSRRRIAKWTEGNEPWQFFIFALKSAAEQFG